MNIIVNFTPTGIIPTKRMTPHAPVSVNEIVEDVHEAYEIGITMVHLHARDEKTGEPTHKGEIYREIIEKIRKFSRDLVVCVSLSGRSMTPEHLQMILNSNDPFKVETLCQGNILRDYSILFSSS